MQRGFDRFYGFLGGETDQFYPELVCGNDYVDPPGTPEDGYHLTGTSSTAESLISAN